MASSTPDCSIIAIELRKQKQKRKSCRGEEEEPKCRKTLQYDDDCYVVAVEPRKKKPKQQSSGDVGEPEASSDSTTDEGRLNK